MTVKECGFSMNVKMQNMNQYINDSLVVQLDLGLEMNTKIGLHTTQPPTHPKIRTEDVVKSGRRRRLLGTGPSKDPYSLVIKPRLLPTFNQDQDSTLQY